MSNTYSNRVSERGISLGLFEFLNKIQVFGPQCAAQLASKLSKAKPVSPQLATLTW